MNTLALILFTVGVGVLAFGVARAWLDRGSKGGEATGETGAFSRICRFLGQTLVRLHIPGMDRAQVRMTRTAAFAGLDDLVWTLEALIGAHAFSVLVATSLGWLLLPGWPPLLRIVTGIGIGVWYAHRRLNLMIQERQATINKGFPYVLDLLHLSVHSGQGINTAIQQISSAVDPGPVREEFSRVIVHVQNGLGLSDAFRRMGARVVSPEVRAVLLALIQAMDRGAQISDTLRTQAEQLRFSRLMAVEEEVEKLPTRMLLPIILFFMPCTLIMVLGPVIISTILSFKGS